MKNAHIINLIRFYAENNDAEFRKEAYKIASEFDKLGKTDSTRTAGKIL